MNGYYQGNAIRIEAEFRSRAAFTAATTTNPLYDPASGGKITIKDKNDVTVTGIDSAAMTKNATGQYYYDWQTSSTTKVGTYKVQVKADDTSFDGFVVEQLFEILTA